MERQRHKVHGSNEGASIPGECAVKEFKELSELMRKEKKAVSLKLRKGSNADKGLQSAKHRGICEL